jgi:hypothetical protein
VMAQEWCWHDRKLYHSVPFQPWFMMWPTVGYLRWGDCESVGVASYGAVKCKPDRPWK